MLGGFGTPNRVRMQLLYRWTLKNCLKVVVRETSSYKVVSKYLENTNVNLVHHSDFSTDVVNKWQHSQNDTNSASGSQKYCLVNLTPYRHIETDLEAVRLSVDVW